MSEKWRNFPCYFLTMKSAIWKQSENGYAFNVAGWLNHNTNVEARERILSLMDALVMHGALAKSAPHRPHRVEDYDKPSAIALRRVEKVIQSILNFYEIRLVADPVRGWDFFWVAAPGSDQEARERRHRATHPPTIMEEAVGPETSALRYVWEALRDGTLGNVVQCSNKCGRWTIRRSKKDNQFCGTTCYRKWYASQPRVKAKKATTARKNYSAARTLEQGKSFVPRSYKKALVSGRSSDKLQNSRSRPKAQATSPRMGTNFTFRRISSR